MTMNTERRKFIAGAGAAAASTAVFAGGQALAQGNQQIGAKAMPYQAKPMPFDPKSITGISEKVLVSHYENNYVGAVKRLNAIGTQLAELDFAKAANFVINGLKREELIASNSMILHEIYFDGLGGGTKPSGALAEAIARGCPTSYSMGSKIDANDPVLGEYRSVLWFSRGRTTSCPS
jgi:superoxide dismutase, Fe-Mn family